MKQPIQSWKSMYIGSREPHPLTHRTHTHHTHTHTPYTSRTTISQQKREGLQRGWMDDNKRMNKDWVEGTQTHSTTSSSHHERCVVEGVLGVDVHFSDCTDTVRINKQVLFRGHHVIFSPSRVQVGTLSTSNGTGSGVNGTMTHNVVFVGHYRWGILTFSDIIKV
jgi:hypothetical protein